jgi:hypothetical protein
MFESSGQKSPCICAGEDVKDNHHSPEGVAYADVFVELRGFTTNDRGLPSQKHLSIEQFDRVIQSGDLLEVRAIPESSLSSAYNQNSPHQ